jgi:putative acetyltransferase
MQAIVHASGEMVGCGAIVLNDDGTGEMKRVYIDARHRGQQLGDKLLNALEAAAVARECHTLRLETGIKQQRQFVFIRAADISSGRLLPLMQKIRSVFLWKNG